MFWFRRVFDKQQRERKLDSELRFHLEQRAAELANAGMAPEEARRCARLEFGGVEGVKQECRESHRSHFFEVLLQDIKYGARIMLRSPGFTMAGVLTLALGIGASTAVFSVVEAILLKPLPYPGASRIVIPWRLMPRELNMGYEVNTWARIDFQLMAAQTTATFQSLGAFYTDSFSLTGSGDPRALDGVRASAGFFPTLGVKPELGRAFTDDEDQPGHEHEVVLSYGLWRDRFAASPAVLGQAITLNGASYTVIGVMPKGFVFPRAEEMPRSLNFPREAQLWVPLALRAGPRQRGEFDVFSIVGRLRPGFSFEQAEAELNVFTRRLENFYVSTYGASVARGWFDFRLVTLPRQVAGDTRRPLLLIMGAVAVVLLLACSNVAGLLLVRSLARQREFALRSALGAGQGRVLRQLLTESLLLALAGGMVGIVVAEGCIRFTKLFGPYSIPRLREAGIDPWVLTVAFAATLVTGIFFGLAPAIVARRTALLSTLKEGGARSAGGAAAPRARRILLVSQMALAVVLVVAAGLLSQTFLHLLNVDPGFNSEHVLTFELSLPPAKYSSKDAVVAFYQRALPQLATVAGVQSAALVETVPMDGSTESSVILVPGRPAKSENDRPYANYSIISPAYFSTVQTPLLSGREFLETDTVDSTPVVVINRTLANTYWPGENPVGKQVGLAGSLFPLMQIVGVCADTKHLSLREDPAPEMYVPYTQKVYPTMQTMALVVRSKADPSSLTGSVRDAVHSLDPDLPLAKVTTLKEIVGNSLVQPRFSMLLLGWFAALAVLLSAIGMYGVISFSVSQRTQEIGIRMALGAQRGNIFAMVLSQGARLATVGVLIGLAAGLGAARMMAGFLYGVRAFDPLTFALVAISLIAVALAACYIPARRAIAVPPTIALRSE